MVSLTQSVRAISLTKTPGLLRWPHGVWPQDVTPCSIPSQISGPPESPCSAMAREGEVGEPPSLPGEPQLPDLGSQIAVTPPSPLSEGGGWDSSRGVSGLSSSEWGRVSSFCAGGAGVQEDSPCWQVGRREVQDPPQEPPTLRAQCGRHLSQAASSAWTVNMCQRE